MHTTTEEQSKDNRRQMFESYHSRLLLYEQEENANVGKSKNKKRVRIMDDKFGPVAIRKENPFDDFLDRHNMGLP